MIPLLFMIFVALLKPPIHLAFGVPFLKQFGEHCDWRGQTEVCDQSRGLACSYQTGTCECWDPRKVFSPKIHRCVAKAGEECAFSDAERMCIDDAYCLEDRALSPYPLCVCLKGYFRSDNGSCIKYSKFGEPCAPYPPNRLTCEPDVGFKCYGYSCQCEPDHIFDQGRDLCIAKAGGACSRVKNNCVENAECTEKIWTLDHVTRETTISGYRCACKSSLKVTDDGHCASEYGGSCSKTSECFPGENLTCLNGVCQCHPLSQIYDKRLRRCFNLVGSKCQPQGKNVNSVPMKNASKTNSKISRDFLSTSTNSSISSDDMFGGERAECIPNSQCVLNTRGGGYHCQCVNGSSETIIKTCLLDYGQSCQTQLHQHQSEKENEIQSRTQIFVLEKEMKCNVFEGFICHSDSGKCLCADPSLVYDEKRKTCVARVGNPCGNLRLGMLDLNEEIKSLIFINCEQNSTCSEQPYSSNGGNNMMGRRICVPHGNGVRVAFGPGGGGSSLSKLLLRNDNISTSL